MGMRVRMRRKKEKKKRPNGIDRPWRLFRLRRKVEGVGEFVRYICPMKMKMKKIREFE